VEGSSDLKILISGGTGFIGKQLLKTLEREQHQLLLLTRRPEQEQATKNIIFLSWMNGDDSWKKQAEGSEVVINLAGENIGSSRWTKRKLAMIEASRLTSGNLLVSAISEWKQKPKLFLQASAIGFYGNSTKEINEESDMGTSYLAELANRWEDSTAELDRLGIPRTILRIGVVLGKDGGLFKKMILPFKLGLGGSLGSGEQGFSWIHIDDVIQAIVFIINSKATGVFNLTAPKPQTLGQFTKALARTLGRPHIFNVPAVFIKLGFGRMGEELILGGAQVFPKRLLASSYIFKYNNMNDAISDLIGK